MGDKITDLLGYFLGPFPEFESTLYNKRLKVYVVQLLLGLKVFEQFCLFFSEVCRIYRCLMLFREIHKGLARNFENW